MTTIDSGLVQKKIRHRGLAAGRVQSVSGVIRIGTGATASAASVATTDLLRFVPLGENVRPTKIVVVAVPVAGTPVLTNPTFAVGITPVLTGNLTRPNGDVFVPPTALATAFATSTVLDSDNMNSTVEVKRPVADSVSKYGPGFLTLTPAGAGAFSVAGGDVDLFVTVEFNGEVNPTGLVYTTYVNQNVNNQT